MPATINTRDPIERTPRDFEPGIGVFVCFLSFMVLLSSDFYG
jgi:hypothetical protein